MPIDTILCEADVPLGATRLAVSDDAAAVNGSVGSEGGREPLLVDIPAKVANEQVLNTLLASGLGLGLLDDGLGLILSLALLGGGLLLIGIAVAGVGVGIGGVIGVRRSLCSCQ
jgi:hypothetical protein